jgi:hypothetical protein
MKVIKNFIYKYVDEQVKLEYGQDHAARRDGYIEKSFKTYPYPKVVGHWFVREDSLYMVIDDGTNT